MAKYWVIETKEFDEIKRVSDTDNLTSAYRTYLENPAKREILKLIQVGANEKEI